MVIRGARATLAAVAMLAVVGTVVGCSSVQSWDATVTAAQDPLSKTEPGAPTGTLRLDGSISTPTPTPAPTTALVVAVTIPTPTPTSIPKPTSTPTPKPTG